VPYMWAGSQSQYYGISFLDSHNVFRFHIREKELYDSEQISVLESLSGMS